MLSQLKSLWQSEEGAVFTMELLLVSTITVLGLVTGLTQVRDAVNAELGDVAGAVEGLDQSFSVPGMSSGGSSVAGSGFQDTPAETSAEIAIAN
jgi:hypothetical protein